MHAPRNVCKEWPRERAKKWSCFTTISWKKHKRKAGAWLGFAPRRELAIRIRRTSLVEISKCTLSGYLCLSATRCCTNKHASASRNANHYAHNPSQMPISVATHAHCSGHKKTRNTTPPHATPPKRQSCGCLSSRVEPPSVSRPATHALKCAENCKPLSHELFVSVHRAAASPRPKRRDGMSKAIW